MSQMHFRMEDLQFITILILISPSHHHFLITRNNKRWILYHQWPHFLNRISSHQTNNILLNLLIKLLVQTAKILYKRADSLSMKRISSSLLFNHLPFFFLPEVDSKDTECNVYKRFSCENHNYCSSSGAKQVLTRIL